MVEMPAITPETHRRMALDVRRQMQPLVQQLRELRAVERYHLQQAGEPLPATVNGSLKQRSLFPPVKADLAWHIAAEVALKALKKPAKIGEMADHLKARGFKPKLKRRLLFNGLYVALKRRSDLFEALDDARWQLKDQDSKSSTD